MISELLIMMGAFAILSFVVKLIFGVPPFIAFLITLVGLVLYDFIHSSKQSDSQGG